MKNYELTLPEEYEESFVVDATNKKFTVTLTIGSLILTVGSIAISLLFVNPFKSSDSLYLSSYFIGCGALLLYIILHELVHGAAYYLLTHHKLKFGLTLTVAFCGVPDIYVYRKAALIALLAPFTVFSFLFILIAAILQNQWDKFIALVLFSFHFGGCIGDLYDTFLYLFKFKDPTTLVQDTGPKQTFFTK